MNFNNDAEEIVFDLHTSLETCIPSGFKKWTALMYVYNFYSATRLHEAGITSNLRSAIRQ